MAKSILIALLVAPIAQSLIAPRPLTRRSALRAEVAEVDEEAPPPLTDAQADAKNGEFRHQLKEHWKALKTQEVDATTVRACVAASRFALLLRHPSATL